MRTLFITWDGPDQNYMESLFLPIFSATQAAWQARGLGKLEIECLQFVWGEQALPRSIAAAAERRSIAYRAMRIMRFRPLQASASATIVRGAITLAHYLTTQRQQGRRIDVVMPRALFPAAMTLLAHSLMPSGSFPAICMDADGLQADERIEFGGWSTAGWSYRLLRWIERQAVRRSASVITRTQAARQVLGARAELPSDDSRIYVVPNGTDETRFTPGDTSHRAAMRAMNGMPADAPWLLYVGSLGPQYYPRAMLELFMHVRRIRPHARLTMLTGQASAVPGLMRAAGLDASTAQAIEARRVPAEEVPRWMAAADIGLALRMPSFSQRAVSPIKVGEYLLCGLPVVATRGVGDLDRQLAAPLVGQLVDDIASDTLARAAEWLVHDVMSRRDAYRQAARRQGEVVFGLRACAARYVMALAACVTP